MRELQERELHPDDWVWVAPEELDALARHVEALTKTLREVRDNARSWHGPEPDMGHVRALAVIAEWCDEALAAVEATPAGEQT
jgi:hypothetical protein